MQAKRSLEAVPGVLSSAEWLVSFLNCGTERLSVDGKRVSDMAVRILFGKSGFKTLGFCPSSDHHDGTLYALKTWRRKTCTALAAGLF